MKKFSSIIVPTDFSECSQNAVRYAVQIARKFDAPLTLFHAFHVPVAYSDVGFALPAGVAEEYADEWEKKLETWASEFEELKLVEYHLAVECGLFRDVVHEFVEDKEIDLMVMGTHGTSTMGNKILGSHSAALIDSTGCPVLAIPCDASFHEEDKIAVAYDHKGIVNPENVELVKQLAEAYKSRIRIVHMNEKFDPQKMDDELNQNHSLRKLLAETHFSYHFRRTGDAEEGLEIYIRRHKIKLIITFHRHHGFWETLFGGSFSKKLINHLNIPVLSIQDFAD